MNRSESKAPRRGLRRWLVGLSACLLLACTAQASSVQKRNLVELIDKSDTIIVGVVDKLSDGIDERGVPYTEVTVQIAERIRGQETGKSYSFRQFGLIKPRKVDDRRTLMAVTPDGWPTYAENEEVMLFLHKPARLTGLQTTVGLNQGKLRISNDRARSGADNLGLFEGVKVASGLLNPKQQKLLASRKGAVDAEALVGMVRRAVQEKWIETGRMKNER